MYLLTFHKTLLASGPDGSLLQIDRHGDVCSAIDVEPMQDGEFFSSGPLAGFRAGIIGGNVVLERGGRYLCAEVDLISAPANREAAGPWETFRLVTQEALADVEIPPEPDAEMLRFAARVNELRDTNQPVKVYFGAGRVPIPGFLNVDIDVHAPEFAAANRDWYFNFPYVGNRVAVPDNCIDFIFDEDLIEHVPQIAQIQYLAETLRMLKSGGYHRVNTPSLLHAMRAHSKFAAGAEGIYTGELRWGHVALFSHASLKEMAELVGYRDIAFNGKGGSVSPYAIPDRRPYDDRDDIFGNIYADLLK